MDKPVAPRVHAIFWPFAFATALFRLAFCAVAKFHHLIQHLQLISFFQHPTVKRLHYPKMKFSATLLALSVVGANALELTPDVSR